MDFNDGFELLLVVAGASTIIITAAVSANRHHQKKLNFLHKRTVEATLNILEFPDFYKGIISESNGKLNSIYVTAIKSKYKKLMTFTDALLSSHFIKYDESGQVKKVKIFLITKPSTWLRIKKKKVKKSKGALLKISFNKIIKVHKDAKTEWAKIVTLTPTEWAKALSTFFTEIINALLRELKTIQNILNGYIQR